VTILTHGLPSTYVATVKEAVFVTVTV